jgi:hypothetical protein
MNFPVVFGSSIMWTESYGGSYIEIAHSVVETSDGGYAIAGSTGSYGVGSHLINSFWLVKIDNFGEIEWNQTYGGLWEDTAYSLVTTSDGGYVLAGRSEDSSNYLTNDFLVVKTDELGNIPEFPSWFFLPIVFSISFIFIVFKKKFIEAKFQ